MNSQQKIIIIFKHKQQKYSNLWYQLRIGSISEQLAQFLMPLAFFFLPPERASLDRSTSKNGFSLPPLFVFHPLQLGLLCHALSWLQQKYNGIEFRGWFHKLVRALYRTIWALPRALRPTFEKQVGHHSEYVLSQILTVASVWNTRETGDIDWFIYFLMWYCRTLLSY